MYFIPTEPGNVLKTKFEEENFKSEQKQKKEFIDTVEKISESAKIQSDIALKTSKKADVKGWVAVIISVLTFLLEVLSRLGII